MTTPINGVSSTNQPLAIETSAEAPPPPKTEHVSIPADAGTRHLVNEHAAANPPACQVQTAKAIEGIVPLVGDFAMVLVSPAAGPVAVGVALANLFHSAFEEGGKLGDLYACKTR